MSTPAGKTVDAAGLRGLPDAFLVTLERGGATVHAVKPSETLQAGDVLWFAAGTEGIISLRKVPGTPPQPPHPPPAPLPLPLANFPALHTAADAITRDWPLHGGVVTVFVKNIGMCIGKSFQNHIRSPTNSINVINCLQIVAMTMLSSMI